MIVNPKLMYIVAREYLNDKLVGGFNTSDNISQLRSFFLIYGKKHVPNRQPINILNQILQ